MIPCGEINHPYYAAVLEAGGKRESEEKDLTEKASCSY